MIDRSRAARALEAAGLDAVVASTLENVEYATGVRPAIDELGVLAFAVVPRDPRRRPALVVPVGQLAVVAQSGVRDVDLHPYGRFVLDREAPAGEAHVDRLRELLATCEPRPAPADALRDALRGAGAVGLDDLRIPAPAFAAIAEALRPARVEPAHALLARLRMRKSPAEVERLREAAEILEAAQAASIAAIAPGVTEQELVDRFEEACRARGATPFGAHIGSGPRSVLPLSTTYTRTLRPGDVVKYDVICSWRGYKADTGRTVVVGHADDAAREAFEAVRAGTLAAVEATRPGARVGDVFRAAVGAVRRAGFPYFDRHQVGHGIGLDVHEAPLLAAGDATVLEPGMVLCLEAPLYSTARGGWQLEDTVVVTDGGCEYLTAAPRDELPVIAA